MLCPLTAACLTFFGAKRAKRRHTDKHTVNMSWHGILGKISKVGGQKALAPCPESPSPCPAS